jgi:hypothetical protein
LPLEGKMYAFSDDMKETDFKKRKFVSWNFPVHGAKVNK